MFTKSLRNAQHTRTFAIAPSETGWEVREEADSRVVRRVEYHDWHRVERARRAMTVEMRQLQQEGWRVE